MVCSSTEILKMISNHDTDKLRDNKAVNLVVVGAVDHPYRHRVHFWPVWLGLEHVRKAEKSCSFWPDLRQEFHTSWLLPSGDNGPGSRRLPMLPAWVQTVWSIMDSAQVSALNSRARPPEVAVPILQFLPSGCGKFLSPSRNPDGPATLQDGDVWGLWERSADQEAWAQPPKGSGRRITGTQWLLLDNSD